MLILSDRDGAQRVVAENPTLVEYPRAEDYDCVSRLQSCANRQHRHAAPVSNREGVPRNPLPYLHPPIVSRIVAAMDPPPSLQPRRAALVVKVCAEGVRLPSCTSPALQFTLSAAVRAPQP